MAKRDPIKTARNKRIEDMKDKLRTLLPTVLKETGFSTESSLNAKIGGKADEFIDLKNEVIHSPTDYAAKYCESFKEHLTDGTGYTTRYDELYDTLNSSKAAQQYMMLFLERSYLKHYEELSKRRPKVEEAAIWIGQNAADRSPRLATLFEGRLGKRQERNPSFQAEILIDRPCDGDRVRDPREKEDLPVQDGRGLSRLF
jgi:hypothetical protein